MGALTKKERDGLENAFLSIDYNNNRYEKIKEISYLIMNYSMTVDFKKLLKQAKYGLKEVKLSRFIHNLSKKKKNLSK
jgi:hypothetical protein